MSPRTGRPPKAESSRNVNLNIRLTVCEAQLIQDCADKLNTSRTDVIVQGVSLLMETMGKK